MPEAAERPPRAFAFALVAVLGAPAAGCQGEVRATIVALPGCGLDETELSALELVARGDFPSDDATRAEHGIVRLPDLPADVAAITIEGKFGDITEAVGRTARLDVEGDIPVYFAPADELCSFPSALDPRDVGAAAVGPQGDVLIVGGRDDRSLLRDVLHARDVDEIVTPLQRLPVAVTGLVVVPLQERRFALVGGARSDRAPDDTYRLVDLAAPDPVGAAARIRVEGVEHVGRAYHAAVTLPDGRSLVTGGCRGFDLDSRCMPSSASVLASGFVIDPATDPPGFVRAPSHLVPRFGHELLAARDGVVFAVGGRSASDRGVVTIERWLPGSDRWEGYGPTADLDLDPDESIVGATLLEGGIVIVATSTGAVGWVGETAADRWWQPGDATFTWCDGDADTPGCFHDESQPMPAIGRRRILALPDERVLADGWLLPIAQVGQGPIQAVDLTLPEPGHAPPPGSRVGAELLLLADGTVLYAGGREPREGVLQLVSPFLLRFRPDLQGPDERIPQVADLRAGSFLAHDPATFEPLATPEDPYNAEGRERARFLEERLQLFSTSVEQQDIPEVWAHVRSFRSASFRFDVTFEAVDEVQPHLVLSHGAVARTSIRFGDRVEGVQRAADGAESPFTCSPTRVGFVAPQPLRFDVTPEKIVIKASGVEIASCPGAGDTPAALGIGASGPGTLKASGMRLTRI